MLPFNYPKNIIEKFTRMLEIKSNEGIQEFVHKYINIPKYSFHQINIFIKLFISQYIKFNSKIKFLNNGKNVTNESIQQFAECTQYFTNVGFAQLLTNNNDDDKNKDSIDKLEVVYDND